MAIFEPQIYLVVEQFGAGNISLLSGHLVFDSFPDKNRYTSKLSPYLILMHVNLLGKGS